MNGIFFDLSERAKIRVLGSDRERFLNGQLTNDVRKASESLAIESCILNAKGRLDGHVFVRLENASFLLDAAAELQETLPARLERYIIADDVQIEIVSDRFSLFHLICSENVALPNESKVISAIRFGEPGSDIWAGSGQHDELFRRLQERVKFCDRECAEVLRMERGIPRWGRELTEEIIPVEANLESRAIDYEKGCYIGQEIISRMKMSGQTNKRLCGLIASAGGRLVAGMKLFATNDPGKEVGWLASAINSERVGREIALGYVKRGYNAPGNKLTAVGQENEPVTPRVPVEIVDLPFVAPASQGEPEPD